jgi:hypothetical protein
MDELEFPDLLECSSLDTPDAKILRAGTPAGMAERIVKRAEELERSRAHQPTEQAGCDLKPPVTAGIYHYHFEEIRVVLRVSLTDFPSRHPEKTSVSTAWTRDSDISGWALEAARLSSLVWQEESAESVSRSAWSSLLRRLREWVLPAVHLLVFLPGRDRMERLFARQDSLQRFVIGNVSQQAYQFRHASFAEFFIRTLPPMERAARLLIEDRGLGDGQVDEAVATVLKQTVHRWRSLSEHPCPTTWMVWHTVKTLDPAASEPEWPQRAARCPYQEAMDLRRAVFRALWRMPTDQREVIGLWATCGFESEQIAQVLNLPERRVRKEKDRALQRLDPERALQELHTG